MHLVPQERSRGGSNRYLPSLTKRASPHGIRAGKAQVSCVHPHQNDDYPFRIRGAGKAIAVVHTEHPRSHPRFRGYPVFKELGVLWGVPQKDTGTLSSAAGRAPGARGLLAPGAQRHHPSAEVRLGNPTAISAAGPSSYVDLTRWSRPLQFFREALHSKPSVAPPGTAVPVRGRKG